MTHPAEGALRRLLDEPSGVPAPDREHAEACSRCRGGLATMAADRDLVAAALEPDGALDLDLDAAWQRLVAAATEGRTGEAHPPARRRPATGRRRLLAGVAVTAALSGAGAAAATGWLPIFRTERVAPLPLDPAALNALPDLDDHGDLVPTGDPDLHRVDDVATAEAETGLDVPRVAVLPRGVEGTPTIRVAGEAGATFTFSAAESARAAGDDAPVAPPGLDGAQVRLVAGPAVAQVWSSTTGPPALLVARAAVPTATSSGPSFEELRDHLLALPGVSEQLAAQLRAVDAEAGTLPLPVPTDRLTTSSAVVDGDPATVLATPDRTVAAVVWVEDGTVTVVGGTLDVDEVLAVARGLR